ncbi:MAG: hypothetical protein L0177_12180 [Chloroflexi bacterium]|nr:hypothetical protein [Chloroflexota bacterium]
MTATSATQKQPSDERPATALFEELLTPAKDAKEARKTLSGTSDLSGC